VGLLLVAAHERASTAWGSVLLQSAQAHMSNLHKKSWNLIFKLSSGGSVHSGDFNDKTAEPWGEELWESYTTADAPDGLLVGVRQDICVQVFPVYPFLQRSILQRRPVYDMRGCPTFVLWLPRDLNAHLFWKRRDLLAPYFWNEDGTPGAITQSV
jgi:hypothetical protein